MHETSGNLRRRNLATAVVTAATAATATATTAATAAAAAAKAIATAAANDDQDDDPQLSRMAAKELHNWMDDRDSAHFKHGKNQPQCDVIQFN